MSKEIINIPGMGIIRDTDIGECKMFTSRREDYEEEKKRVNCNNYDQCPVCYKCINKAGHLYEQCERCNIPLCHHNHESRKKLIRPNNFVLVANDELKESILKDVKTLKEMKEGKDNDKK